MSSGTMSSFSYMPSHTNSAEKDMKMQHETKQNASHMKGWYIQPTCAITGEGLQEGLDALYEMILKRRKINKSHKKRR
ncbi:blast:ADP-ribosylation factor-like protein 4A [Drosophila guanche]|uniref:Blast:ADP-ribosylation factor-like protein 4A n=2 Tax=Drosophila guanche TaxID=7266 RepID=A0A3B0KR08_DROGU|nr:blast:ADP-ribosylation factor-like protein 4A [Drosophila guanche]